MSEGSTHRTALLAIEPGQLLADRPKHRIVRDSHCQQLLQSPVSSPGHARGRLSSVRRRLASDTCMPTFRVPVVQLGLADALPPERTGRRRTGRMQTRTLMACSYVNRFRFIVRSPRTDPTLHREHFWEQVTDTARSGDPRQQGRRRDVVRRLGVVPDARAVGRRASVAVGGDPGTALASPLAPAGTDMDAETAERA